MIWLRATIIVTVVMTALGAALMLSWPRSQVKTIPASRLIMINGHTIQVDIADTPVKQFQGLSDRPNICSRCGMLFIFPRREEQVFVMRRMYFPLDIIWLDNNRVVGMSLNLPPESSEPYTPYASNGMVNMVLELPAGAAQNYNIQVGDILSL